MTEQIQSDHTGALIVATPAADDPYTSGLEDPHVTLLWFGESALLPPDLLPAISDHCAMVSGEFEPMDVTVSGVGILGPDKASVLLLESRELVAMRADLADNPAVQAAWEMAEQFPWMVYHLTTGYEGDLPKDPPETIRIDSLGFWVGDQRSAFLLGEAGEPVSASACLIPTIDCLADLSVGVHYAREHPAARWYVAKRAHALGAGHRIPESWTVMS